MTAPIPSGSVSSTEDSAKSSWLRRSWLRIAGLPWTFYLYLFAVLSSLAIMTDNWDINDLYWHTRMGQDIWENHRLTGADEWTFGPVGDTSWVTTQALSETLMYGWWKIFGWNGFLLIRIIFCLIFSLVMFYCARMLSPRGTRFSRDRAAFLISGLVIYLSAGLMEERPQTVSLILAVPLGIVLLRVLELNRWPHPAAVFFIVMVWGWIHGSALFVGPLLLLAYLLRAVLIRIGKVRLPTAGYGNSGRWRWILVLVAAFVAPAVNPIGIEMYTRALRIKEASQDFISEWQGVEAHSLAFSFTFSLVMVWALSVAVKLWRRESWRIPLLEGTWIAVLLIVGVTSLRVFAFFTFLLIPLITRRLTQLWKRKLSTKAKKEKTGFWTTIEETPKLFLMLLLIMFALTIPLEWTKADSVPPDTPRTILAGLAQEKNRQVLVDWNLNGRAQLFGGDDISTFVDGRTDRYGSDVIKQYSTVLDVLPGWLDIWNEYEPTDIVVKKKAALADRVASMGWRKVCEDKEYVWYAENGLPGACLETNTLQTTGLG